MPSARSKRSIYAMSHANRWVLARFLATTCATHHRDGYRAFAGNKGVVFLDKVSLDPGAKLWKHSASDSARWYRSSRPSSKSRRILSLHILWSIFRYCYKNVASSGSKSPRVSWHGIRKGRKGRFGLPVIRLQCSCFITRRWSSRGVYIHRWMFSWWVYEWAGISI